MAIRSVAEALQQFDALLAELSPSITVTVLRDIAERVEMLLEASEDDEDDDEEDDDLYTDEEDDDDDDGDDDEDDEEPA